MNYQFKNTWNVAFGQPQERFIDIASGPQNIYVLVTVPDYPVVRVYVRVYRPSDGAHLRDVELQADTIIPAAPASAFDVRQDGHIIATSSTDIDGASVYYVDQYGADGSRLQRTAITREPLSLHKGYANRVLVSLAGEPRSYIRMAEDFAIEYTGEEVLPLENPFAVVPGPSNNIVGDMHTGLYAQLGLCEEDGTLIRSYGQLVGHSIVTGCADSTRCYATVRYPYPEYRTRVYVSEMKENGASQLFDDTIGTAPYSPMATRAYVVFTLNPDTGDVRRYVDIDIYGRGLSFLPSGGGCHAGPRTVARM